MTKTRIPEINLCWEEENEKPSFQLGGSGKRGFQTKEISKKGLLLFL